MNIMEYYFIIIFIIILNYTKVKLDILHNQTTSVCYCNQNNLPVLKGIRTNKIFLEVVFT